MDWRQDGGGGGGGDRSSSSLHDDEIHNALDAVNFVAVHLKNDDEFAEVGHSHTLHARAGGLRNDRCPQSQQSNKNYAKIGSVTILQLLGVVHQFFGCF